MNYAIHPFRITTHDLTCPVCLQKYDSTNFQPLSLQCGHNLCSKCVLKMVFCPICREYIHNRGRLAKNALVCSLIESQKKVTECKHHHKPVEFFCKEHNCILCVDCGFKGGHFSHDIIHIREVEKRLEDTKELVKEIGKENEKCKESFETFLHNQDNKIKRGIDEMFDEYLGPLIAVKKKIHKEFDTFFISEFERFNKDLEGHDVMDWKQKNKLLVDEWAVKKEGNIANQLLSNKRQKIEKKLQEADLEEDIMNFEKEAVEQMEQMLRTLKNTLKPLNTAFPQINSVISKKLKTRNQEIDSIHVDDNEEVQNLTEYLRDFGLPVSCFEEDHENIIEIKGELKLTKPTNVKQKYFECHLAKLRLTLKDISVEVMEVIFPILSKIQTLVDFKIWLVNVREKDVFYLIKNLPNLKFLKQFSFYLSDEHHGSSGRVLPDLSRSLAKLVYLKAVAITFDLKADFMNAPDDSEEKEFHPPINLEEIDLCFINCDDLMLESLPLILKKLLLEKAILPKFSFILSGCERGICEQSFGILRKQVPKMNHLRDLTLAFENMSQFPQANQPLMDFPAFLEKLALSFMATVPQQAVSLQEYIKHIAQQVPDLKSLMVDWSHTPGTFSSWPNVFGTYLCKLEKLASFNLAMKGCQLEPQFVETLCLHYLPSLENLRFLKIDLRENGLKTVQSNNQIHEAFERLARPSEKELLLDPSVNRSGLSSPSSSDFDEGNRGFYQWSSSNSSY